MPRLMEEYLGIGLLDACTLLKGESLFEYEPAQLWPFDVGILSKDESESLFEYKPTLPLLRPFDVDMGF